MKRTKLLIFGLFASFGIAFGMNTKPIQVRAEEEPAIVEVVEEEDNEIVDELSQAAKDFVAKVDAVLSHPLTIGATSTTLGAILIGLLAKLFGSIKTKKIKENAENIKSLIETNQDKDNQIANLRVALNNLEKVAYMLAESCKNGEVKENARKLLLECKPIEEHAQETAKNIKEEIKEEVIKDTNDFLDILKK